MKYLKRFNESIEEKIYQQVFDTIKDCFQEFEDNGWYWSQDPDNNLSYHPMPHFKYIMKKREKDHIFSYDPYNYKKFEFTGEINSSGDISWEKRTTTNSVNFSSEDYQDFIIAIKRLHDETGLDFEFSYNNLWETNRIIIQGKI